MNKHALIIILTILTTSIVASSYQAVDAQYKSDNYILKVHWADIYNMQPKMHHAERSTLKLLPQKNLKIKNCKVMVNHKSYSLSKEVIFSGFKLREFTVSCSVVNRRNRSKSFEHRFIVEPKTEKNSKLRLSQGAIVIKRID